MSRLRSWERSRLAAAGCLPHTSHALGSGGVAETEQQRCRVATSGQGLKPSNSAHKVGLQFVVGVSPNVGRMAAVIDDDATHGVGDMGSGGVEVRVATRDNGGAKGVTVTTGRNKQLHHRRGLLGRRCIRVMGPSNAALILQYAPS